MDKGYIMVAMGDDYVRQAYLCALSIKKTQSIKNVSIVTSDIVPEEYKSVFDKIIADSLYISGKVSDGIITEIDGSWEKIMGYKPVNLVGKPYDRDDLIHPDDLKAAKKIQKKLKNSESITFSKYSAIQRWKNGETGKYIMLSMVWDINVNEDLALIVCKPIDGFISD